MTTDNHTAVDNSTTVAQPDTASGTVRNFVSLVSLIIYCVIFLAGTVGNGLVIYVTGFRMKRTVNSVWFLNLALADFLFTAFLIFSIISLSQDHHWHFGGFMCKLNTLVLVLNMFASIFLLTAISLDRCLSSWVVVWAQNKRTVRKAQLICAVIWLAALVCSTPYATFRERQWRENSSFCDYTESFKKQYWILVIFRFVVGFLIPFLVISLCYVAIVVRAGRLQRTSKKKPRRIIFSIIFAFFICWLPFHVVQFINLSYNSGSIKTIGTLTVCLAFMNSCLNPILYVFMCDEFQKKIKQSICFVLESALAEDHLSFMSSRSLSSHFSRITRRSDSVAPFEGKERSASLTFTESKAVTAEERETLSTD